MRRLKGLNSAAYQEGGDHYGELGLLLLASEHGEGPGSAATPPKYISASATVSEPWPSVCGLMIRSMS